MAMTDEEKTKFIRKLNEFYTGAKLQKMMIKTGPTTIRCPCCLQSTTTQAAAELAAKHFGGMLECEVCTRKIALNKEAFERALGHEWPTCCNKQMLWKTQHEIDQEVV